MNQKNIRMAKKRKNERVKIRTLFELQDQLKKEGYLVDVSEKVKMKQEMQQIVSMEDDVFERFYQTLSQAEITYRVNNAGELVDYIKKIILFEKLHDEIYKKLSKIRTLRIDREEYERVAGVQEEVTQLLKEIETTANAISSVIDKKDKMRLEKIEKQIKKDHLYAKDIELLKKLIGRKQENITETYDSKSSIKTIEIQMPQTITMDYIKAKRGSVEYYQHISSYIPRMQRIIKNLDQYVKLDETDKTVVRINQSEALQDSINLAVAIFDQKEFKAISGQDEIEHFCMAPPVNDQRFQSHKVNKHGKLGIGYNRVNDSEKKIFEAIQRQIEAGGVKDSGTLMLYSKWEPCPSCYLVIQQFMQRHPKIQVQVRYDKTYGRDADE